MKCGIRVAVTTPSHACCCFEYLKTNQKPTKTETSVSMDILSPIQLLLKHYKLLQKGELKISDYSKHDHKTLVN